MTELLDRAFSVAKSLPDDVQDEAAKTMLAYLGYDQTPFELTSEDEEVVARSRAAVARGEFASEEQLRAIRSKYKR